MTNADPTVQKRARLAEIERDLARLRCRHDAAMSAFRFDEATALGPAIAACEREWQTLAAALPGDIADEAAGVAPVLIRPRRRRPRRAS